MAEIAGEGGQPAATEQTAAVAHRVLAAHPGPVRQRRPGDDDGAEQLGADGGEHHDGPSRLAITDDTGLAVGLGMQGDDLFKEDRLRTRDVADGLAWHGVRQETDEIAGMPRLERHADLAVGLEAADARAMPGARVDDDERPPRRIELDGRRRDHFHESIVDRPIKRPAVDEELDLIVEHVRSGLGQVLAVLVAAVTHHIPEQHAALRGIHHVLHGGGKHSERRKRAGRCWACLAGRHCRYSRSCSFISACHLLRHFK